MKFSPSVYVGGENFREKYQLTRRLSAMKSSTMRTVLNFAVSFSGYSEFKGSKGVYQTSLNSCGCEDFRRRNIPCKHMYRLALELELIPGPFSSYLHGGYDWKQVIEIVERLPDDAQRGRGRCGSRSTRSKYHSCLYSQITFLPCLKYHR